MGPHYPRIIQFLLTLPLYQIVPVNLLRDLAHCLLSTTKHNLVLSLVVLMVILLMNLLVREPRKITNL